MTSTRGSQLDFIPGECVLCFEPDLSKARVLYDAKVLDIMTSKDARGRRKIEYMVHFQGWNSSWDRVVPEAYIIKNSERNRKLMRRLADIARHIKRNKARMRRIDAILKQHFKKRPKFDSDSSDSENSSDNTGEDKSEDENEDVDEDSEDVSGDEDNTDSAHLSNGNHTETSDSEKEEGSELEDIEPTAVELELPGSLKRKLEFDCLAILKRNKLVRLPAEDNVITLLEGYVKNFGVNVLCATTEKQRPYPSREQGQHTAPEKNIDLCKEVMDGIRIYFDFTLPMVLLYKSEQDQYHDLIYSKTPVLPQQITESDEAKRSSLCTPPASRCQGDGEPATKQPRLSPQAAVKKEEDEFSDEEYGPPRRITRKAFAEELRRSSLKNYEKETTATPEQPTTKKTRTDSQAKKQPESSKTPRSSTRGRTTSERSNQSASHKANKPPLSERVSPPPPILLPGSVSSASSNLDTPTSSALEQTLFRHREKAVNEIFSWKILPESEYRRSPIPPSLVYGPHHLLRLFVKLPEFLSQMPVPRDKLPHLVKHLELFIEYMSSQANELFPESAYIDNTDVNGRD